MMKRDSIAVPWFLLLAILAALFGCESKPAAPPVAAKAPGVPTAEEQKEIEANLAKLSPEDRALAAAQRICPVSEQLLGMPPMETPIAVQVGGRKVFICCEACRDSLLENPDPFLAKLPAGDGADPSAAEPK